MAYGFDEGKNKVTFADYFTYVIDSQAKFDDWVNGVSGNDYSYVAIIGGKGSGTNGAYVQTISNDLTGKTKGIQGFCGARIDVNGDSGLLYGVRYESLPMGTNYFVRDLIVNVVGAPSGCYPFSRCINLTNCTGSAINRGVGSSQRYACAFTRCINLTNCTGSAINRGVWSSQRYACAFVHCINLTNCTGEGSGSDSSGIFSAFDRCKRLSFCTATGKTPKYNECYVTSTANETYKIPANGSDTPNGGFNV